MPWQLRSSRLQRGSPLGSNQSAPHRPPRTSVFTTPVLFVFNPSGIRSHPAADRALATDGW